MRACRPTGRRYSPRTWSTARRTSSGKSFGDTLAAGDVDGDGDAELVTSLSSPTCCGTRVGVLFGTSSGLTTTGAQAWSQDSPGILGVTQPDEQFGAALAIGDFDGDGFGDVAATSAGEAVGTTSNAGAVNVLYGSPAGLTAAGNQLWNEDVAGVPGTADNDDQFGRALAAGDFDGDGTADLAVGVPLEAPGGAVIALYGSAGGLAVAGSQLWSQGSAGVPGTRETADRFGSALAAADYGRSGRADLAIGVRNEKLRGKHQAGFVNVLYGRSGGLAGAHAQGWSQGSAGVHGAVEAVDRFGRALSP